MTVDQSYTCMEPSFSRCASDMLLLCQNNCVLCILAVRREEVPREEGEERVGKKREDARRMWMEEGYAREIGRGRERIKEEAIG